MNILCNIVAILAENDDKNMINLKKDRWNSGLLNA